jgi:hypothetical protein
VAGLVACSNSGADRVVGLDATSTVLGTVYVDLNGNRELDFGFDAGIKDIGVRLTVARGHEDFGSATSDFDGLFTISRVPVGRYTLAVDDETVPDSMLVVRVDTSEIVLTATDSAEVAVAISFPIVSVADARAAAPGDKVFIEGTALNDIAAFADNTIHVLSASGAIRATRAFGAVVPGDSVRLRGTMAVFDGQPVLNNAAVYVLGLGSRPRAQVVSTGVAVSADGGALDAALVRLPSLAIVDTGTVAESGDFRAVLDDGSGTVSVMFDRDLFFDVVPFAPDTVITATGLRVPTGLDTWVVKPRSVSDVLRR